MIPATGRRGSLEPALCNFYSSASAREGYANAQYIEVHVAALLGCQSHKCAHVGRGHNGGDCYRAEGSLSITTTKLISARPNYEPKDSPYLPQRLSLLCNLMAFIGKALLDRVD